MKHLEHEHQKALIQWAWHTKLPPASDVELGAPVAWYLFAIPNGGARSLREGARLKAEGVKPGVSDLLLPLRRHGLAGMWLELKAPGEKPSKVQREWLARMALAGYRAEWRDDWRDAAAALSDYLGIESQARTIRAAA